MIAAFLIVLLGESFTALGQILYKKNTNRLEAHSLNSMRSYFVFMKDVLLLPGIWLGLLSMAIGLIIWLVALSRFDLSFVFPASSILYVLILFASRVFLNEKIDAMKLIGTSLVMVGIIAITFG
jgi:uncharacterized membrane protein